jgi:hypothetical protein
MVATVGASTFSIESNQIELNRIKKNTICSIGFDTARFGHNHRDSKELRIFDSESFLLKKLKN